MTILSIRNQVLLYTTLLSSLSFFCLIKPEVILQQGTILLLADAMEIPNYPYTANSLAPAGFVLAVLTLVYFVILVRNDMAFLSALAPLRFIMSFAICGWSYFSSNIRTGNSLIFTFGFGDMIFQYWMVCHGCMELMYSTRLLDKAQAQGAQLESIIPA